ncbi:MAG: hypothetical protein ACRC1R_00630 [Cetobacterium sp.]
MIIVVSDNNLERFEKKLIKTHQSYDVEDVDIDSSNGIFIARFTVN